MRNKNMSMDAIVEMYERMQTCCMLKCQLEVMIEKTNEISLIEKNLSYHMPVHLLQLLIAYVQVTVDCIKKNNAQIIDVGRFNEILQSKYKVGDKNETLEFILFHFRNKTFHTQKKTIFNTEEIYRLFLIDCNKDISNLIEIFDKNIKNNQDFILDKNMLYYDSRYFKKIHKKKV